ncbi:MAG: hypothetical protein QNJ45_27450 [Ardenticatenaceae bacterium]|nr:hypothetical protein [Ardenticatenaceae bacterium]
MKKIIAYLIMLLLMGFVAACGGQGETAAVAVETPELSPELSEENEPALTPTKFEKYALPMGQTAEGAFFIGNEDAPVTMIDYSNYL